MTKWKLRVEWLGQGYTSSKWQSQDLHSGQPNFKVWFLCSLNLDVSSYTIIRGEKEHRNKTLTIQQLKERNINILVKIFIVFSTFTTFFPYL